MNDKTILYWVPDMEGGNDIARFHEHDDACLLPGDATKWLLSSLICAGIALMFHITVTATSYWRYVEKNGTVLQRDGLWMSCVKVQEVQVHQLECEDVSSLTVDVVFKIIQAVDLITFVFMAIALISNIVAFYQAGKEMVHVIALRISITTHILSAVTVMILLIGFLIDTHRISNIFPAGDKTYSLEWCFYLAIGTIVLEFITAFLIAIHLHIIRKNSLEEDIERIQERVAAQLPRPPQKPLPFIGLQQFQNPDGSVQSIPVVQSLDQNSNMPVVGYPMVQPIGLDQSMPMIQAMQPMPVAQQPSYPRPFYSMY